jgi:hypothetical protein
MRFILRMISQKSVTGLYVHDFVISNSNAAILHLASLTDNDADIQVIDDYESSCDFFHICCITDNLWNYYEIVSESWHNVDECCLVCLNVPCSYVHCFITSLEAVWLLQ